MILASPDEIIQAINIVLLINICKLHSIIIEYVIQFIRDICLFGSGVSADRQISIEQLIHFVRYTEIFAILSYCHSL